MLIQLSDLVGKSGDDAKDGTKSRGQDLWDVLLRLLDEGSRRAVRQFESERFHQTAGMDDEPGPAMHQDSRLRRSAR